MSQQHAAWEVRLDRDGHVLPPLAPEPGGDGDDGGGRYLVVPQHDGSLDLLALEVFANRQQEAALAPDAQSPATAADPSRYDRHALGDLSREPAAAIPLPDDRQLTLIDPRQPDRPQPQAISSSSPEALQSALSGSMSEWTYWLTQNRDARMVYQREHQQRSHPEAASGPASGASAPVRSPSARLTPVVQPGS